MTRLRALSGLVIVLTGISDSVTSGESARSQGLPHSMTQVEPVPELIPPPTGLGLEDFGHDFMRLVLHRDRIMASIDRILGEDFALGPIGAGPGRRLARATARGRYGKTYGEELPDPELGYRVFLPVDVDFDLDLHVDNLRFTPT